MKQVLLVDLDSKIPNLALMRLAAHHRDRGDSVTLTHSTQPQLFFKPDLVYASQVFSKSKQKTLRLLQNYPESIVGGTGWNVPLSLEDIGISTGRLDYSIYPKWKQSFGFTQRGCDLSCEFCVVPVKEGKVRPAATIADIYRGEPHPRELVLLDNDFFSEKHPWRDRMEEIKVGNFKVSFNQGINARKLTDESAAAIASVRYYDDNMKTRRIYTAWGNRRDEGRLFRGLDVLVKHGVKPDHIMVYMLIGFWPNETQEDWVYRQRRLREFGARPYPMKYVSTPATIGFQRWCLRRIDLKISWPDFVKANYRSERFRRMPSDQLDLPCDASIATDH